MEIKLNPWKKIRKKLFSKRNLEKHFLLYLYS